MFPSYFNSTKVKTIFEKTKLAPISTQRRSGAEKKPLRLRASALKNLRI
jgi:hypothetical protein